MLDRQIAPPYQTIDKIDILQVETHSLDNQLPLHLLHAGEQELLRVELIYSPKNYAPKAGISYFTAKMLGEGTKKHSASAITEYIDQFGAFIDFSHGADRLGITVYTLSKYLENILQILQEIITEATFPAKEFENLKQITLQNILVNQKKNNYVASRKFKELLFGQNHPYGRSLDENSLQKVAREDLVTYFQQNILHQPLDITLSGKITDTHLQQINQYLGSLKITPQKTSQKIEPTLPNYQGQKRLITREESLQSSIRIGKEICHKTHPDYFKVAVTNEILGGYFGSRLMKNIREDKGFTYGIYSSLVHFKNTGYWIIGTDVAKDVTQQTIDEIYKEISKLQTELVGEKEMETVKNYILGSFAGSINTPFDLGDIFKTIYFYGLDYTFYDQYIATIQNITSEEIRATAQKHLQIEEMLEVVVGGK